ncbi:MAG: hypothetical protein ABJB74_11825 [Gemmatimonas sp.]
MNIRSYPKQFLALTVMFAHPNIFASAQSSVTGTHFVVTERARINPEAVDAKASLSFVGGATMMPNGALLVSQPMEKLLRLFDSSGHFQRSLGRPGKGPNEFESIQGLGRVGDTVYVIDHRNRRITLFPNAKTSNLSLRLPLAQIRGVEYSGPLALLADGAAITNSVTASESEGSVQTLYLHNRDGTDLTKLITLKDNDYSTPIKFGAIKLPFPQPLVISPRVLYSSVSGRVALLTTTFPEKSGTASLQVIWMDKSGRKDAQTISTPVSVVRASDIDSLLDMFSKSIAPLLRASGAIVTVESLREATGKVLVKRKYFPIVEQVFMDDDGRAWVKIRNESEWLIFTHGARRVDGIILPKNASPLTANGSKLWVQSVDVDDLPTLIRYEIRNAIPRMKTGTAGNP